MRKGTANVRGVIMLRDGFRCRYCPRRLFPWSYPAAEIDHIKPVFHGGISHLTNYALACRPCNRKKGTKNWEPSPLTRWGHLINLLVLLEII